MSGARSPSEPDWHQRSQSGVAPCCIQREGYAYPHEIALLLQAMAASEMLRWLNPRSMLSVRPQKNAITS